MACLVQVFARLRNMATTRTEHASLAEAATTAAEFEVLRHGIHRLSCQLAAIEYIFEELVSFLFLQENSGTAAFHRRHK